MATAADWSSLPSDLLNLVADGLLSTGDVDCYVSLRAVCHNWRDATADPRGPGTRFLPLRWVMLEPHAGRVQDSDTRRLFLNVDTGRFVWKDLPVLHDHACVATDSDGLLVLQGPTGFSALNPFTGVSVRFPLQHPTYAPSGRTVAAGSSPVAVLCSLKDQEHGALVDLNSELAPQWIFAAKPALDSFASVVSCRGRVFVMDSKGTIAELERRWRITTVVAGDWQEAWRPSYLVDNAGELLAVRAPTFRDIAQVFRVDLENKALHVIKSIGNRAIFLGTRSLSVDAANLPAVEANCVYCIDDMFEPMQRRVYMHRLEDGSHEKLFEPIGPVLAVITERCCQVRPLSLPHVLMDYATYDRPGMHYLGYVQSRVQKLGELLFSYLKKLNGQWGTQVYSTIIDPLDMAVNSVTNKWSKLENITTPIL